MNSSINITLWYECLLHTYYTFSDHQTALYIREILILSQIMDFQSTLEVLWKCQGFQWIDNPHIRMWSADKKNIDFDFVNHVRDSVQFYLIYACGSDIILQYAPVYINFHVNQASHYHRCKSGYWQRQINDSSISSADSHLQYHKPLLESLMTEPFVCSPFVQYGIGRHLLPQ